MRGSTSLARVRDCDSFPVLDSYYFLHSCTRTVIYLLNVVRVAGRARAGARYLEIFTLSQRM